MLVYRLSSRKYAGDLSGRGAAIFGGRWNKKGTPVLYTGESVDIALLETVVNTPPMLVPELDLLTLEIPDSVTILKVEALPSNWKNYPAPAVLAEIGQNWVDQAETLALKVPSSVISTSWNFILNCNHPEYRDKVVIRKREAFEFDTRLLK